MARPHRTTLPGTLIPLTLLTLLVLLPAQQCRPAPAYATEPAQRTVVVMPFTPSATDTGAPADGLGAALQNMAENTLVLHPEVRELYFLNVIEQLFPTRERALQWMAGKAELPREALKKAKVDAVLYGILTQAKGQPAVQARWRNLASGEEYSATLPVDIASGLHQFRLKLFALQQEAGLPMPTAQQAKSLYKEQTSLAALQAHGKGYAHHFLGAYRDRDKSYPLEPYEAAVQAAPMSYLVLNNAGWGYFRNKQWKAAQYLLERALAVNPHGVDALDGLVALAKNAKADSEEAQHSVKKAEARGDDAALLSLSPVLSRLARGHYDKGNYQAALPLYKKALAIRLKVLGEEHPNTATSYNNLAVMYSALGDFAKAKELHEKALAIHLKVLGEECPDTATSYNNLAGVYKSLGGFAKAKELHEKALAIRLKVLGEEHPDTATAYNNLALVYKYLGDFARAKELYEKTLAIELKVLGGEHPDAAISYNNLAGVYESLGDFAKAKELYEKALTIHLKVLGEEHPDTATSYNNLARVYYSLGDFAKAKELYEKTLAIELKVLGQEHPSTAISYNNLASVYNSLGDFVRAKELQEKTLAIHLKVFGEEHLSTARSYNNLASTLDNLKDPQGAHSYYKKAFEIGMKSSGVDLQQVISANLGRSYEQFGDREAAIFHGKISINILQGMRSKQQGLDKTLQKSFLGSVEENYKYLARLLTEQGRLVEAQQVLNMLKEEELFDFLTRAPAEDTRTGRVSYIGPEVEAQRTLQTHMDALGALGTRMVPLAEKQRKGGISKDEEQHLTALRQQASTEEAKLHAFMNGLQASLASLGPQKSDAALKAQLGLQDHLKPVLALMQPGTVLLHTIMAEDTLWILATTPGGELPVARKTAISYKDLSVKIRDFRQMLVDRAKDPRPLAKELYDALITPVQDILDKEQTHTLLLSLDGPLRYIPPAALHDGTQWLAQKYAVSIFTEAARESLRSLPTASGQTADSAAPWRVAGLGVTKGHGKFSPLPAVAGELAAIVQSPENPHASLQGEYVLDEDFTAARMQQLLHKKYPVVHVATHFEFNPGTVHTSYVLTGDGQQLTLAQLKGEDFPFAGVDQLTLSACNTAMTAASSGSEVEGFGALAQRKGAQTVLATLWPVADASTGALMARYYKEKGTDSSKAEALRRAQRACISGTLHATNSTTKTTRGKAATTAAAKGHASFPGFSHPYFWAPFILMGNWQ